MFSEAKDKQQILIIKQADFCCGGAYDVIAERKFYALNKKKESKTEIDFSRVHAEQKLSYAVVEP